MSKHTDSSVFIYRNSLLIANTFLNTVENYQTRVFYRWYLYRTKYRNHLKNTEVILVYKIFYRLCYGLRNCMDSCVILE